MAGVVHACGNRGVMKRAPISAVGAALAIAVAASAAAQSKTTYHPVKRTVRAEREISASEVHITPTNMQAGSTSIDVAGDHWVARGYDLKTLLSQVYEVDERRIDFADDGWADARYDVTLQLPREVDQDRMQSMLQTALEGKFGVKIAAEQRTMDVYVLTAPNGPGVALHRHGGMAKLAAQSSDDSGSDDAGQITYFGKDCSGVSSGGIAASAGTIGELRRTLEPDLDRPLVDETHLTGSYDFKIGNYANENELFKLMHDELGIAVTPTQRKVTVLTVRPAQEMQAAL
jgi:uncharacterized protein (TIGR03435 family)